MNKIFKKAIYAMVSVVMLVTSIVVFTSCEPSDAFGVATQEIPVKPLEKNSKIEDMKLDWELVSQDYELFSIRERLNGYMVSYEGEVEKKRDPIFFDLGLNIFFSRPEDMYVATEAELSTVSLKASNHLEPLKDTVQANYGCETITSIQEHTFRFDQNELVPAQSLYMMLQDANKVYPYLGVRSLKYTDFKSERNEQLSNADSIVHDITLIFTAEIEIHENATTRAVDASLRDYIINVPCQRIYKIQKPDAKDEYLKAIVLGTSDVINRQKMTRDVSVTTAEIWSVSGQKNEKTETLSIPFGVEQPSMLSVYTTNAEYITTVNEMLTTSENQKVSGNWTVTTRTQSYSSAATNGISPFTNPYVVTDGKISYKRAEAEVEFPYGTWTISEGKTTIGNPVAEGDYQVYPYQNNIDYIYALTDDNFKGAAQANRKIYVGNTKIEKLETIVVDYTDVLKDNERKMSVTTVERWSDGEERNKVTENFSVPFSITAPIAQNIYTVNTNYRTDSKGMTNGNKSTKVSGNWSVTTRTQTYASVADNGANPFDNKYVVSDAEVVYNKDGAILTFPYGTWSVTEGNTTIGSAIRKGNYDIYPYVNNVNYTYAITDSQSSGTAKADRDLYIAKDDEFVETLLIESSDVINGDNRVITVKTADVYSVSGQHDPITETISLPIVFTSPAKQTVYTKNVNYTTKSNGKKDGSETTRTEGNFSVTTMNRSYSSTASNSDKNFDNSYSMSDSKVTYKKNNVSLSFAYGAWGIEEAYSTVGSATESGNYNVYPYENKVNYTYSIATDSKTGSGKSNVDLYVEKPAQPDDEFQKTILISSSDVIEGDNRVITVKTADVWSVSGQHDAVTETITLPISFSSPAKQTVYTSNVDYTTTANGQKDGTETTRNEGNFSITTMNRSYSSTAKNNDKNFDNSYSMSDSKATYKKNDVSLSFAYGSWTVSEVSSTVGSATEDGNYNVYPYANSVNYTYAITSGSKTGSGKSEANLYVEKPAQPTDEFEKTILIDSSDVIEGDNRVITVKTADVWSVSGQHETVTEKITLPISFSSPSKQTVYTSNVNYTTTANGQKDGTETTRNEGNFSISTMNRSYSSTAKNNDKNFDNAYSMSDSKATYKKNDVSLSFAYGSWTVSEVSSTVGSATEDGNYNVYPYANSVNYTYAITSGSKTGSGKSEANLYVEKPAQPKDEITGYDLEGSHKIENGNRVFTVTPITIYSISGRVAGTPVTYSCPISFSNPSSQDIYTSNVSYTTSSNGVKDGSESSKTDGNWTVKTMSRTYSSTAANGDKNFNNNYTMSDSKVSYSWNGKTVSFDYGTWEVKEVSSNIGSATESGNYNVYPYENKVSYTFTAGGDKVEGNGQSNVNLYVEKPAQPTDEFEKTILIDSSDVIEGDNRVITVKTADIWSVSGQHETVTEKITLPISFSSPAKQTVYTSNVDYTTTANGQKDGSETTRTEGNFSISTMNRSYSSTAKNNDKNFDNSYSMSDSKATYKKNDVSLSFAYGSWTVSEVSSTVGSATEDGDYNVYPYANSVNYTYTITSGSKEGNGKSEANLYVEKPVEKSIPEAWGKIIGAGITAVPSDDLGDKTNIAKKCLTIRTDKGAVAVVFDWDNNICSTSAVTGGYFVEGSFDGSYNSGYWTTSANKGKYETGKWAPAIAKDESDRIAYYSGSTKVRQVKHSVLDMWGWKNGHSTKVSGYTFDVSENGTLTIKKDGNKVLSIR